MTSFRERDDADTLLKRAAVALHHAKEPREGDHGVAAKNRVYVLETEEDG